jgi:YjbE family integral membrane protein
MGLDLLNPDFWMSLGSVILINIVLSGDNAVVIALASRNLPVNQQKQAVLWGSFGAISLRVLLTLVAIYMLKIPLLQVIGGGLLIWIAVKLLVEEKDEECEYNADCLLAAIKTIIFADLVMSMDNVIAVAGATQGNIPLLILSLAVSIPLIIWGSNMMMHMMEKYPIIVTLGAALLGYTAGEMIVADAYVANVLHGTLEFLHLGIPIITTLGVVVGGRVLQARKRAALQHEKTTVHTS